MGQWVREGKQGEGRRKKEEGEKKKIRCLGNEYHQLVDLKFTASSKSLLFIFLPLFLVSVGLMGRRRDSTHLS